MKKVAFMCVLALTICSLMFSFADMNQVPSEKVSHLFTSTKSNTLTVSLDLGDTIESAGIYIGDKQVLATIKIEGPKLKINSVELMPLNTTFTIKVYTAKGKRYTLKATTPEIMDFELEKQIFQMNRNAVYWIPANPAKGFNYSYFIAIPTKTMKTGKMPYEMFVSTNNTGRVSVAQEFFTQDALSQVQYGYINALANECNGVAVMTTFPRPQTSWQYYTHALDRDTMQVTPAVLAKTQMGDFTRLDLQFKAIMEDAKKQLEGNDLLINGKPIFQGFSGSGEFGNRYALMHPDTLKGLMISHGTTLPMTNYNNSKLIYPMGVADLKELTGITYDDVAFRALPQFWFRGAIDDNDPTPFEDGWDNMGATYRKIFGESNSGRKTNQVSIFEKAGYTNIKFKEYPNVGHWISTEMYLDMITFAKSLK